MTASDPGVRLRLARQARGYSQQQLAGMAGVSRQAVSAVEAGHSDPSLRVALALAQALGMTIEELFGPGKPPPPVLAQPAARLGPAGSRVTLAPMGDAFVALPLAGDTAAPAGFLPAGGVVVDAVARAVDGKADGAGVRGPSAGPGAWPGEGGAPGSARTPGPGGRPGGGGPSAVVPGGGAPGRGGPSGGGPGEEPAELVRPIAPPRPTLVVAGCDPALPLLGTPLGRLDPPVGFTWWPCSSGEALHLAAAGLVHAAGAHLRGRTGEYNTDPAREWLKRGGAEVIGFASWREGLVLRPDLAGEIFDLADVAKHRVRLVNREEGSEARRVLEREAARLGVAVQSLPGYHSRASGHLHVAAAIAAGLADVGVASEPAALAYSLAFVPLAAERFDLVIPVAQAASREVQALRKVLASPWLLTQLASLPGYDPSRCGERVAAW